ncbi:MAG: SRPBCC family protein [Acidimicrobiia bacterium]|nr:MAG: SRPBCC family protein [Acidimicrobiia bacterium]
MDGTVRTSEAAAPPEVVFSVAADLAAYPEWATGVAAVEILETDADGRAGRARFEVDGFIKRITYELEYEYQAPNRISWSAVPGEDIEEMEGYYEFSARDGGTEVVYALRVKPAFAVPGFLRRQAEKQIVQAALRGLTRRAEELASAG